VAADIPDEKRLALPDELEKLRGIPQIQDPAGQGGSARGLLRVENSPLGKLIQLRVRHAAIGKMRPDGINDELNNFVFGPRSLDKGKKLPMKQQLQS
jgi:hypothetical protein